MYVDEPVLIVCGVGAAVSALRSPGVIAERMVWGGTSQSLERTVILHSEEIRDKEPVCVPKHERDSRPEMWTHAAHRLR